jgi:hypothetical protein
MAKPKLPALDLDSYEHLVEFFDQGVMAAYLQQADRFVVQTDHFEGHLSSRYDEESPPPPDPIDIRFGYRTLESGDLAIAAFRPDLYRKSPAHVERWAAFRLKDPRWVSPDERYSSWLRRYLDGDWDVKSGPRTRLEVILRRINALTMEMIGARLFDSDSTESLTFPLAQNTHRYEDAHQALYGLLIDGLDKGCIKAIAAKAGVSLKLDSDKTVAALKKLPSMPPETSLLWSAFDRTSEQRRLAGHKVRPPAVRLLAFEQFSQDLEQWVAGLYDLLACLEKLLGMRGDMAEKRQSAKQGLPEIVAPPQPHYSICQLPEIEGKTVARVEYGFQKTYPRVHQSEAMILHFTDGSTLGIHTGSNAGNLALDHEDLHPDDFHVDFILQWVPSPSEKSDRNGG